MLLWMVGIDVSQYLEAVPPPAVTGPDSEGFQIIGAIQGLMFFPSVYDDFRGATQTYWKGLAISMQLNFRH